MNMMASLDAVIYTILLLADRIIFQTLSVAKARSFNAIARTTDFK